MKKFPVESFSLERTVESGQMFMYEKLDSDHYRIFSHGEYFEVKQEENVLKFRGESKEFIQRYFNLTTDYNTYYEKALDELSTDPLLKKAVEEYKGLRITRQEVRECIIGFICSSASNISKIKKNLKLISKHFGEKEGSIYKFPELGGIDCQETLKKCKTGYRAEYIYETEKRLTHDFLTRLKSMSYKKAFKELQKLPGVGPKVADCVCLFALDHKKAFPVDTWVKRAVEKHYFNSRTKSLKEIKEFAEREFGEYAGLAQQFLFCRERSE